MVGEGICRCAYGQAHVQCSDARDLSAPLTLQRGAHSATQAQSLDSSPFLCHVSESSHSSVLGGIFALMERKYAKCCCMGYRGQSCDDWHMLMEFIDYPFPTGVCDADEVPRAVLD